MDWSGSINESLPAPRDDEPASLRKDIEDELRDHLQSALRRQLLQTPDADQAQGIVLGRFGNPRAIARQLWFDALKEKMMSQRLVVGLMVVMTLVCVASLGMTMRAIDRGHQANLALIQQTQVLNQAVITKLENLSRPTPATTSFEWNEVKIPLVTPDPKSQAVPDGCKVTLQGRVLDPSKDTTIKGTMGDGYVDFGLVRTGRQRLAISTPWNEYMSCDLDVRPGQSKYAPIVVPVSQPAKVEITFGVDWPADLRDEKLWLAMNVMSEGRKIGDGDWYTNRGNQPVLLTNTGTVMTLPARRSSVASEQMLSLAIRNRAEEVPPWDTGWQWNSRNRASGTEFVIDNPSPMPNVVWPAIDYFVESLLVVKDPGESAETFRSLKVLGGIVQGEDLRRIPVRSAPASPISGPAPAPGTSPPEMKSGFIVVTSKNQPRFSASEGGTNRWEIKLPADFYETLRAALAEEKTAKRHL